jgi:hypothetical protein
MFLSLHASIGKWQLLFVCGKRNGNYRLFVANENKKANFRFFAANGNGKRKFVFLGQKMINGNQQLLFLQTCPSMVTTPLGVTFNKLR